MTISTKKPLYAEVHNVPDDYEFTGEELNRIIAGDMFTPRQDAIMAREIQKLRAAMLHGAEPVSQAYNLPELIEGMEVSIDVSTCDADLGNRYFGTVTEALELDTAKNGYILLVQDAEPNFDVNGNSPVIPDGWVMVPKELTPEMMRAVQIRSELGGYATSNLSGAYNMFSEFWNVAVSAAPKVDDL